MHGDKGEGGTSPRLGRPPSASDTSYSCHLTSCLYVESRWTYTTRSRDGGVRVEGASHGVHLGSLQGRVPPSTLGRES